MAALRDRQQASLNEMASRPLLEDIPEVPSAASKSRGSRRRAKTLAFDSYGAQHDKAPHNTIERRYRNNINDHIAALRNAVPALRDLMPKSNGGSTPLAPRKKGKKGEPEDLVDGVSAATKLNKATILGKATEYIYHLKKREGQLSSEVEGLKELIRSFHGGEDLLTLWTQEMMMLQLRRDKEQAHLNSLFPEPKHDPPAPLDDRMLESDDSTGSPSSSHHGTSDLAGRARPSTGSYVMAAFLGFTLMSTNPELHHPQLASHPSARALSASQQLWKRSLPHGTSDVHHYDRVSTLTLLFEIIRFVAFVAAAIFALLPACRTLAHQPSARPPHSLDNPLPTVSKRPLPTAPSRRWTMLDVLAQSDVGPSSIDETLRKALHAPQDSLTASFSLVAYLTQWVVEHMRSHMAELRAAVQQSRAYLKREPPPLFATDSERTRVDMWNQLLSIETACGSFAQPSLTRKAHTIAQVALMNRHGSKTETPRLEKGDLRDHDDARDLQGNTLWSADPAEEHRSVRDSNPAQTHALLALSLGRLGSPHNPVGLLARTVAHLYWERARAQQAKEFWLREILAGELDDALPLLPSEAETSSAATMAKGDTESLLFLGSPLHLVANTSRMACLYSTWSALFPHLIAAASPTTFCACARLEREHGSFAHLPQAVGSRFDGASFSPIRPEQASMPESGVDINAFLREFFVRLRRGLVKVELSYPSSYSSATSGKSELPCAIQDLLQQLQHQSVPHTPSHYLTRITLATWAFLQAKPTEARVHAFPLLAAVRSGSSMLGTRAAAVLCVELVLGPGIWESATGPVDASASNAGTHQLTTTKDDPSGSILRGSPILADDRAIVAWATAGLEWLLFLRQLGMHRHIFQNHGRVKDMSANASLLERCFAVRRSLARVPLSCPTLRATAPTLVQADMDPLRLVSATLSLSDALDRATDVLSDLCRFLGERASAFPGAASVGEDDVPARAESSASVEEGAEDANLIWIPEDLGAGNVVIHY